MPIPVTCPMCGAQDLVADGYQGRGVPCKKCGQNVPVPALGMSPSGAAVVAGAGIGAGMIVLIVVGILLFVAVACGGVLVALLLPAVQAARGAARTMESMNNMKQITLALHNYNDANGRFPPAYIADENGKPMHSWRVLILPYLEQQHVYNQYDMSKPWDSPENLLVANMVPPTYRSKLEKEDPNLRTHTSYLFMGGAGTAVVDGKGPTVGDLSDGLSNTIAIVEVNGSGVVWTQPTDLDAAALDFMIRDMNSAQPGQLNTASPRGLHVGMFDGSVKALPFGTSPEQIRAASTAKEGEQVFLP